MSSTGEKFPTAAQTIAESPWSDATWSNPSNIYSDDGNYARSVVSGSLQSYVLKAYTFDFSDIPDGSTIDGVICRVNAWKSGGTGTLSLMQLLSTARAKGGTNQCAAPVTLTSTQTTIITKGSSVDLWGNALTPTWVKDADFGVALGVTGSAASSDGIIDYVSLEIYYTPPELTLETGETLTLADDTIKTTTISKADTLTLTDGITTSLNPPTSFYDFADDILTLTDAIVTFVTYKRILTDTLTITDAQTKAWTVSRTNTDGITLYEENVNQYSPASIGGVWTLKVVTDATWSNPAVGAFHWKLV